MFLVNFVCLQIIKHFPCLFARLGSVYTKCKILNILKFGQNQIYSSITYYASPPCPTKVGPVQHQLPAVYKMETGMDCESPNGKTFKNFPDDSHLLPAEQY